MRRILVCTLLALLLLCSVVGLRNAVASQVDNAPVMVAVGGAPPPPIPNFGVGGAPPPPIPNFGVGGAPPPPIPNGN